MSVSSLWMLSAGRGAGKTTFCRTLASLARLAGWHVAGLVSPAIFQDGVKTGILVEELQTGKTLPLACSDLSPDTIPANFDLPFGEWHFDRTNLEWGNHILESCLPCDLLIVDELGPLELVRGEGWSAALEVLRQPRYRLGLVVVRPELQEAASAVLPMRGILGLDESRPPEEAAQAWWLERQHGEPT